MTVAVPSMSASKEGGHSGTLLFGVGSWLLCSVGMMICNKMAIKALPTPCTLVGIQFLFAVAVMVVVCYRSLHIGSLRDVMRWAMVVPFFTGMILSSILALEYAPMSLVITFRALSPMFSLVAERFYPSPVQVTSLMVLSLAGMLVGVGFYVWDMDKSHLSGMCWAVLNIFLAVGDRLLQRLMLSQEQSPVDISKTGLTLLNNLLGCIPLLVAGYFTSEFERVPSAVAELDVVGWVWVIASCVAGVGVSYTGIWVQSLITATSFLVLVNASKFGVILYEAYVIKENSLRVMQIFGACISIMASVAYSKAREQAEAPRKEEAVVRLMRRESPAKGEKDERDSHTPILTAV